ncbi:F-box domain-containing protein [Favolaschia claudopus]|uniref:F-box domain-containing protein n=1 Tax=Favolaschia claudopus TaxID=2862362 RepID=A0AAW0BF73_9AGAR
MIEPSTISTDILDTNNPPAEHDFPALRDFIERATARRAFLDDFIDPLKVEFDLLREERSALEVEIRKHERAVSPLRRFPTELMSEIFAQAVQPCEILKDSSNSYFLDMQSGPWLLSAVCSRWRGIALSQPNLWAFLPLNFRRRRSTLERVAGTLSIVQAHIDRSQNAPFKLIFIPSYTTRLLEVEQDVLGRLIPHIARWEELVISGTPALYKSLATRSASTGFPTLRTLAILVHKAGNEGIRNVFDSCPRLEEVFFNMESKDNTPVDFYVDTTILRRYGAKNSWERHIDVLSNANNLVDCVLRFTFPFRPVLTETKIQLPHLSRLAVIHNKALDFLEAPALQELYCCDHLPELYDQLRQFPSLQKLFVGAPPHSVTVDLDSFMHSVPTVTSLCVYLPMNSAPAMFKVLRTSSTTIQQNQDSTSDGLPFLRTLALCIGPQSSTDIGGPLNQDELMHAIETQWRRGLRSLHIYVAKFVPSENTLERMETLRQQGMHLVLEKHALQVYQRMVEPDFRLYTDSYDLSEAMMGFWNST